MIGRRRTAQALLVATILGGPVAAAGDPPDRARFDVRRYGARGDGHTDDTGALQAALDAARRAGGGVVVLPAGTFLVGPPGPPAPGGNLRSITLGPHVSLRGAGEATVLKVKPGTGSYRALFTGYPDAAGPLEDVTVSDLRVDQDCARSGAALQAGTEGRRMAVLLSYAPRRVAVERVRFDRVCGVNTVVLNAPAGAHLTVRDCTFRFERGPTMPPGRFYDNSAVYLHGRDLTATGNTFEARFSEGARGAIELHGAEGLAAGNVTRGYRACVRVVGTSEPQERPPARNGFVVRENRCLDANDAINLWSVTGHGLRGVEVVDNELTLAPLEHHRADPQVETYTGISLFWDAVSGKLDGDVADVVVSRNRISVRPVGDYVPRPSSSGAIAIRCTGNISRVAVEGNVVERAPTQAIRVQAMRRGARARDVRVRENVLIEPAYLGKRGLGAIAAAGELERVAVEDNRILASRHRPGDLALAPGVTARGNVRLPPAPPREDAREERRRPPRPGAERDGHRR